jgi:hypothetical protein
MLKRAVRVSRLELPAASKAIEEDRVGDNPPLFPANSSCPFTSSERVVGTGGRLPSLVTS